MLDVLEHECLDLIHDEEFHRGQKVLVNCAFKFVCFIIKLMTAEHPDG